jgi:hypothetical protein
MYNFSIISIIPNEDVKQIIDETDKNNKYVKMFKELRRKETNKNIIE